MRAKCLPRSRRCWPSLAAFPFVLLTLCCSPPPPEPANARAGRATCPETPLAETRRIYDFTPVGPSNPIVAAVDDCWIQIPVGELRGHLSAELDDEERQSLTPEGKRQQLDRLIDEHLILMDAYRQKADQSERAVAMLAQTRKMLLGEYLAAKEIDAKATRADEQDRLRRQLVGRAFERATISVSNEGYAALQQAVKVLAAHADTEDPARLAAGLPQALRTRPLATFDDTNVTVADAAAVYLSLPAKTRPALDSHQGLEALLQHLLEYELLAAEAVAQGIDRTRPFLEKVELNRTAIVRMWSRDHLAQRVRQRLSAPGLESRLHAWHAAHALTRYTFKDADGKDRVLPFAGNEERIRSDYSDALREEMRAEEARLLRQGHRIAIEAAVLAGG
jgi:hypothetical protein